MVKKIAFTFMMAHSVIFYAQVFHSQEINLGVTESYGNFSADGGSGVSFSDFNMDGKEDLTFSTEDGQDILFYENKGGHYELIQPSLVTNMHEGRQVLWIDFDNDGDKDLLYATFGHGVYLYQNDGNMNLTDVTVSIGLHSNNDSVSGASFGDINNDGYLDLYLSNYDLPNKLYVFDGITFTDITDSSTTSNGIATSFCASLFDFNNDGWLDIYVINDKIQHPNALYMNLSNNQFVNVSVPSGSDLAIDAMNGGIGDFNQDGFFDVYVTDEHTSVLLENLGDNTFIDATIATNTTFDRLGWGGNFFDFDNDEDEDLYVSCGWTDTTNPSALYVNDSSIFSEPLINSGGIAGSDTIGSFVNVIGDVNNDGLLDVVTGGRGGLPFRMFLNHDLSLNNFIKIDLVGVNSNRDGYGAIIDVRTGGVSRKILSLSANAYLAQNSDYLHIGMGQSTTIDTMIIQWPFANSIDTLTNNDLTLNKLNTVVEGNQNVVVEGLDLCIRDHIIYNNPIPSQIYVGANMVFADTPLSVNSNVEFQSSNEIFLEPGFEVTLGTTFHAYYGTCQN